MVPVCIFITNDHAYNPYLYHGTNGLLVDELTVHQLV